MPKATVSEHSVWTLGDVLTDPIHFMVWCHLIRGDWTTVILVSLVWLFDLVVTSLVCECSSKDCTRKSLLIRGDISTKIMLNYWLYFAHRTMPNAQYILSVFRTAVKSRLTECTRCTTNCSCMSVLVSGCNIIWDRLCDTAGLDESDDEALLAEISRQKLLHVEFPESWWSQTLEFLGKCCWSSFEHLYEV